jgi:ABC-type uncharacterized transport system permease subunit
MDGRALTAEAAERRTRRLAAAVIAAGAALLVGLIALAGENPLRVLGLLVQGAFLTPAGIADSVVRMIPLCLMALGIALAFRARIFNIGAEGQFLIGAATGAALAVPLAGLPGALALPVLLAAGAAGGALWGAVAGVLRARFNASEIIATILLNHIAFNVLSWLIRGPLQESAGVFPRTERLPAEFRLPLMIDGTRISAGLLVALIAVVVVWVVMARSRFGFQIAALGENPEAARYGGVASGAVTVAGLAISGALAGLAGIVEVAGVHGRIQDGFGAGLGITAIAVALLARLNPLWVPVSALGFAGLHVGSATVARATAVPFPLVNIIEGTIIVAFLAAGLLARTDRGGHGRG